MWRLLNKLTGYSSLVDYNGDVVDKGKKGEGVSPPRLDRCEVAGAADLARMLGSALRNNFFALSPALEFLRINRRDGYAHFILKTPGDAKAPPRRVRFTNKKYHEHLISLVEDLVLQECAVEEVSFFSSYFSVLKDLATSRAIFNGRALSESWRTPPPVNIPDICSVIQKFTSTATTRTYCVTGDLRHWFHQISISAELSKYMALFISGPGGGKPGGRAYKYRVLPMGFSYSPWLAQSLSWLLLSHRFDRESVLIDESLLRHAGCLPTFLPVLYKGRECGWATVYYDNYLVVVDNEEAAVALSNRIVRNAQYFNIKIKEGTHKIVTPSDLGCCGLEYLGIRYKVHKSKRPRDSSCNHSVTWELKTPLKELHTLTTKRDAARAIGKVMFHMVIHCAPLGLVEGFLDLVSILKTLAAFPGWDVPHNLDDSQLKIIQQRWDFARANTPFFHRQDAHVDLNTVTDILATDAARKGFGWVHIADGFVHAPFEGTWTTEELGKWTTPRTIKIFLMEMHAAVEGLLWFFRKNPLCSKVLLAIDNSGVAYCLRKGYSSLDEAHEMITRILHLLPRVEIMQVTTQDNCADCPSRRQYDDFAQRVGRTVLVCKAQIRGIKIGVAAPRRAFLHQTSHDDGDFADEIGVDWAEESCSVEEDQPNFAMSS